MKYLEPQHMLGLRVMSKKGLDAYVFVNFLLFLQFLRDHSQNLRHQRHLREIKKNSQILAILNNSSYLCIEKYNILWRTMFQQWHPSL